MRLLSSKTRLWMAGASWMLVLSRRSHTVVGFAGPRKRTTTTTSLARTAGAFVRSVSSVLQPHETAPTRFLATTTTTSSDLSSSSSSSYWSTDKVRETFVTYFSQQHNHTYQPSSSCVPLNDPTLLFANAGMNQFKPIFLGQVDPTSPLARLNTAVNSQKCIRAGGKHNDLEDVGRDTYHHTFFEMLGSWSFGNYFQQEAIAYAWELLVQVYGLEAERLYATYFEGNDQVPVDAAARDFWLQYLPPERVIGCDAKDNFWEMGDTGPCGPCSEVHYDRIGDRDASALVNADDPDVIEIWNLVFIQFNRNEQGELSTLPSKHVDTGMGLERLVSILQDKSSNYDIDVFQPLFDKLAEHSQVGVYEGKVLEDDTTLKDTAYRAIADHARTLAFAIADGAVPSNEGRGYVLRRVLRRATRYGQQILKAEPGFFSTLVPVVVDTFGEVYPELVKNQETILDIVKEEEQAFSSMLVRGIKYFSDLKSEIKEEGKKEVSGEKVFYLYDTLGFPVDLTELMAEEAGLTVDSDGFTREMEAQKQRSREARNAAKSGGGVRLELIAQQTAWLTNNEIEPTDDFFKYKNNVELPATVLAIFSADGFITDGSTLESGASVGVILDKSSFYSEAGGQEADLGTLDITSDSGDRTGRFQVTDVQSYAGYLLHTGVMEEGSLKVGSTVNCKVDYGRRRLVAPNHSMTHVLNAALRQVLGDGVDQRGSLCNDEKLRFDFSHKKAMSAKQLRETEEICQTAIANAEPVTNQMLPLAKAKEIDGVRAMFDEVYPDPVRVVRVGDATSVEFCGGTHLENTSEAAAFVIVEETAVAKGIRRITAITKDAAEQAIQEGVDMESQVSVLEALNDDTPGLDKKAGVLRKALDESFMSAPLKAELRSRIEVVQKRGVEAKKRALAGRVDRCLNDVKSNVETAVSDGKPALVLDVEIGADSKASQKVMNAARDVAPGMAFMGISEEEPGSGGKLLAFAFVPDSLVDRGFKADDWVRATLEVCGGRGGGKSGSAQGQAKECSNPEDVLAAAQAFVDGKVGATTK